MKRSIFKSLRTELIVYSICSIVLALLTEVVVGTVLYLVSSAMGISKGGYGRNPKLRPIQETVWEARDGNILPGYNQLCHLGRNTLFNMMLVIVIAAVFLFVVYFLLFIRRILKDMTYISDSIAYISNGDMTEKIEVGREDELGEIAVRVNEMAEELQRLMETEREALQTNKDLITCVAHDLRTPITSVMGYLELAMDMDHYTVEERQKYAGIALQKSRRLEGLIQDLFTYTKLMSGEVTLKRQRIDVVQLVEQMVEEFYPLFQDNDLDYRLKKNIDHLELYVDAELLARAVQNLLSNAVKYGRDGKCVNITLEKLEREVQISVTNFGLIIPKESIAHIFDKFYRVEGSRSTTTGGTGLGLNIAKEIVVLHGGTIQVESGIQGTCFTIALPVDKEKEGEEEKIGQLQ